MKPNTLLRAASVLSILLTTLHVTDDIVRGLDPARPGNVGAIAIFTVWLVGTLWLGDHWLGYIIMLLGGLAATAVPVLHMRGARYPVIATSSGGFFFVWTLIALGVTGAFAVILSLRAFWGLRSKNQP